MVARSDGTKGSLIAREAELRAHLESLHARYHRAEFLPGDPLTVAHRYAEGADREVVALLAAAFASGNIKSILAVLERLLAPMGLHPARWLRDQPAAALAPHFAGVQHRWARPDDITRMLAMVGGTLRRHGSLGALWQTVDDPAAPDTWDALAGFVEAITSTPVSELAAPRDRRARRADGSESPLAAVETILLTSPRRGSACKRMHLFLRWVARPADGIDLGLWTGFLSPARLVVPLDTHVLQQSRALGLTAARTPTAAAAREITAALRRIAPDDPTRYDFALVRAGIAG